MNIPAKTFLISMISTLILFISCQSHKDKTEPSEEIVSSSIDTESNKDKEMIKAVVERILIAVGNRDVNELRALTYEQAIIGWTYTKDEAWSNKLISMAEYLESISKQTNPKPFSETAIDFDISITDGRIASVRLPTIISEFGIVKTEEVNLMTMLKENDQWKLFSVVWTAHRIPEAERSFDLELFAQSYAQVWGSNRPEFVAMFFEEGGKLQINEANPAKGRKAISKTAESFMTQFPDMEVHFDSLFNKNNGIEFHWTLTGTDADPAGNKNKVNISGYELWTISENKLIKESKGTFSSEEYNRQLTLGKDK